MLRRGGSLVRVGQNEVSLAGVDKILERFYLEGWSPGEVGLEEVLVGALREAGNYIPTGQTSAFAAALRELFRQFCAANAAGIGAKN